MKKPKVTTPNMPLVNRNDDFDFSTLKSKSVCIALEGETGHSGFVDDFIHIVDVLARAWNISYLNITMNLVKYPTEENPDQLAIMLMAI